MFSVEFQTEYDYPDVPSGITVPVELSSGRAVRLLATVDTGAAYCLFKSDYAEGLGLILANGRPQKFSTPSGEAIVGYGHEVTMIVLGHSIDTTVYFTDHPGFKRDVLGRQGWLHYFKFGLIHYNQKLYLGHYGT